MQPPAPQFSTRATLFQAPTTVKLGAAFEGLQIRYTLDGSVPSIKSALYSQPLSIKQTAKLQARAYTRDGRASRLVTLNLRKMAPQAPQKVKQVEKGLRFSYYEGNWTSLPDFKALQANKTGISSQINLAEIGHRDNQFAVVMEGYIEVAQTGTQTFFLNSDDGSKLYINDELIIDHDGDHSAIKKTGQTILAAGKHKIRIEYFERSGGQFLQAGLMDEQMGAMPFKPFQLGHE